MLQEIYADAVDVLPILLDAIQFYFSSALLVCVALGIALLHSLAAVYNGRQFKVSLSTLVTIAGFVGRVVLTFAMIVVAGTLTWSQLTEQNAWSDIFRNLAVTWDYEGVKMGVQLIVVGVLGIVLNFGLERLLSEYRTAQLVQRMQRPWTPGTVRVILLLGISNLLFAPILLAAMLKIFHFI